MKNIPHVDASYFSVQGTCLWAFGAMFCPDIAARQGIAMQRLTNNRIPGPSRIFHLVRQFLMLLLHVRTVVRYGRKEDPGCVLGKGVFFYGSGDQCENRWDFSCMAPERYNRSETFRCFFGLLVDVVVVAASRFLLDACVEMHKKAYHTIKRQRQAV